MSAPVRGPDGLTLLLFAGAVSLGAGNFLAVRLSNLALPPFWGAGLRFALAGLTFVALAAALRLAVPHGRVVLLMALFGVLSFGAFYAFMYWALLHVTAGVATVVLAVVPLATVLLAAAQGLEPLRRRSVLGGLVAVGGIAWMTLEPGQVDLSTGPLLALLAAVVCVAQSFVVGKRLSAHHPALVNAVGMLTGAAGLLLLSALVGEPWHAPTGTAPTIAVIYLVTFGSVGLFLLGLTVIRRWTASASSYMFVLFPVVTLGLEAVLLAEPVTLAAVVGALLVMAGVWFGALAPAGRAGRPGTSGAT